MPTFSLRWFFILAAVFLVAIGADIYLSRSVAPGVNASSAQRLEAADFIGAARAGELTQGHIIFRANATGLADVIAQRTVGAGATAAAVRTTARLTDGDLALLRDL